MPVNGRSWGNVVSEGGLEPPCPLRALAPQASASAYSATRTRDAGYRIGWPTLANRTPSSECPGTPNLPPSPRTPRHHRTSDPSKCDDGAVTANQLTAQDEVVDICRDLIRIDTSNPGDHSGPGERLAAEHVAGLLAEAGLEPQILESHPKRANVVARIAGADRGRPGLLIHG